MQTSSGRLADGSAKSLRQSLRQRSGLQVHSSGLELPLISHPIASGMFVKADVNARVAVLAQFPEGFEFQHAEEGG